jgi:D-cysteine desulfhydrase
MLARRPTPLVPLHRLGDDLGVNLWCKRDDLTGFGLSGNKVRKLDHLLADAEAQGADVLLTTGGIQSNHARATAVAARMRGLDVGLLLRGEAPTPAGTDGNLLLDHLLGAALRWCTPEDYRARRNELLAGWAEELRAEGRRPYVIPEGGSNGRGALGFVDAAREVGEQAAALGLRFDAVVCAVGSGGTLAGLAMGVHAGLPGPVVGVAVCDDAATFEAAVLRIAAEAAPLGAPPLGTLGTDWRVLEGYQGAGYGIAGAEVWGWVRQAARREGLLLDPVYTGKALHGLAGEIAAGRIGGDVLFWHTGGAFGLFGRGEEALTCGAR